MPRRKGVGDYHIAIAPSTEMVLPSRVERKGGARLRAVQHREIGLHGTTPQSKGAVPRFASYSAPSTATTPRQAPRRGPSSAQEKKRQRATSSSNRQFANTADGAHHLLSVQWTEKCLAEAMVIARTFNIGCLRGLTIAEFAGLRLLLGAAPAAWLELFWRLWVELALKKDRRIPRPAWRLANVVPALHLPYLAPSLQHPNNR